MSKWKSAWVDPPGFFRLQSRLQLALSAGWLFGAFAALSLGFCLKKPGMRIAAIGLLNLAILKVFVYDLSFSPGFTGLFRSCLWVSF